MKRLSLLALLSVVMSPAFAADTPETVSAESVETATVAEVVAETAPVASEPVVTTPVAEPVPMAEETIPETTEPVVKESDGSFFDGVQIGVGVSATGGLNGFVGYANKNFDSFWAKRFGVRFDFATTQPLETTINDAVDSIIGDEGIDIGDNLTISDAKIDAQHFAALVDFYPFGDTWLLGAWRLTGGYAFGDMNVAAGIAGTIDGPSGYYEFELSGQKYAYTGNSVHGTAELDWQYRGPYLGTGVDIGLLAGLKIYVDAGVVFTNKAAELSLDVPTDNLKQWNGTNWVAVDVPELENVIKETLSDAQSELDDLKFYPMVKVGFMYRF